MDRFNQVFRSHAKAIALVIVAAAVAAALVAQAAPPAHRRLGMAATAAAPNPIVTPISNPSFTPIPQATVKPAPALAKATPVTTSSHPAPVVTPAPSSNVSGLTPIPPESGGGGASSTSPSSTPAPPTTTGYYSTNWSGYLAAIGTFTSVSGSWVVSAATGPSGQTSADATWIGIGGVTSGDLIQVGTDNIIAANGQITTGAFYELLPAASIPITALTVAPGDTMTASVTETSSGQWTITITDATTNTSFTISLAYNSTLSSAEWIQEDPSSGLRHLIPLDNFAPVLFSGGRTMENGSSVTIAGATAEPVTMVNSSGQTVALPSALNGAGTGFSVTRIQPSG